MPTLPRREAGKARKAWLGPGPRGRAAGRLVLVVLFSLLCLTDGPNLESESVRAGALGARAAPLSSWG